MIKLQEEIAMLSAQAEPKEVVDYREKITVLQYALEQYTNKDEGRDVPESVIEAFVTKIVVSQNGFDWYLRFDGDPDDPLHCKIEGKRPQKLWWQGQIPLPYIPETQAAIKTGEA